ncbi:MAG TPA: DHHA1 domain-containing protein, partial [Methylocystis sp.]|nr:DHHA1 domain-containing protein [Methylocystis sp.]
TAEGARSQLIQQAKALREMAALVRAPVEEAPARLAALLEERRRLEQELAEAKRQLAMGEGGGPAQDVLDVAGVKLFSRAVSGVDSKDLKSLVDDAKKKIGSGVVAIASASADGKAGVVVGVTDDLTGKFNAVDFVRVASEKLGGKGGGGRPDLAQAGGPDSGAIEAALAAVREALRAKAAS